MAEHAPRCSGTATRWSPTPPGTAWRRRCSAHSAPERDGTPPTATSAGTPASMPRCARLRSPTREMDNQRWAGMEAFGVMMRTHEGNPGPKRPRTPRCTTPPSRAKHSRGMTCPTADRARPGTGSESSSRRSRRPLALRQPGHPGTSAAESEPAVLLRSRHPRRAGDGRGCTPSVDVDAPGTWVYLLGQASTTATGRPRCRHTLGTPAAFVARRPILMLSRSLPWWPDAELWFVLVGEMIDTATSGGVRPGRRRPGGTAR